MVFVPVAINYDRVFEDRILVAAGERGERRFHARISVVARFILHQFWLWLTRRYHRHGYAAVSFGAPLSLAGFQQDHPGAPVEALGQHLMQRIGDEVPVVPVPLVARALLTEGAMPRSGLEQAVAKMVSHLPHRDMCLPRADMAHAVESGLRTLLRRGLVSETDGVIAPVGEHEAILAFYARSIAHLFCARSV